MFLRSVKSSASQSSSQAWKRKIVKLTGFGVLASVLTVAQLHIVLAASLDEVKSRGYIAVATEDDFKPFEFVENGTPTGFDTELLGLVKKKMSIDIKQDIMPWPGILPGVTTGKYEAAVTAVLVTAERKGTFDFTTPVAESTTYFATKKGSSVKSVDDLVGKVVGAQTGSAMLGDLKALDSDLKKKHGGNGIKEIVEYQSYPEAYQDVGNGRLDAVANTQINLNSLIQTRPDMFVLGAKVGSPVYIAWALKKGNTGVLQLLNGALLDIRKSGAMYQLQKKWFGATFESMPQSVN
jgi:polar amino acid transport system substrate-binding protein